MKTNFVVTLFVAFAAFSINAAAQVNMAFSTVGNPGNAADPLTGMGEVDQTYAIGTYDVTLSQYCAFLNAVATTSDPYSLYNANLGTDTFIEGITQNITLGGYSYSVIGGSGADPVTYVSWFDAARFCNWLSNGQPIGAEGNGTTETGAYTLSGTMSGTGINKNANAQYWIPTGDEWYKAAYYDPALNSGSGGYWLYPTRSNTAPGNSWASRTSPNEANYGWNLTGPSQLTPVGSFTNSASAYGTFDQGGNVWQWSDTTYAGAYRVQLGSSWYNDTYDMQSYINSTGDPTTESDIIGFRIATIPEPATTACLIVGAGMFALRRRR